MPWTKKRYADQQKKDVLSLLKEFEKRVRSGELVVETFGTWVGREGHINLKVVVKESEKSQLF